MCACACLREHCVCGVYVCGERTRDKRRKKNAKETVNNLHTHMHTHFRRLSSNIHVGCCLFSHKNNQIHVEETVVLSWHYYLPWRVWFTITTLNNNCTVVQHKKNTEHTHMHTNFRRFSSQYSRRLLSILAHPQQQKTIRNISGVNATLINSHYAFLQQDFV